MDANELRALADALPEGVHWSDPITPDMLAEAIRRFCADAQPVAWRTFDGEGNYDYRAYELNEDYADEWNRRNPNHVGWVEPLYTHPAPAAPDEWKLVPVEPTPEMLSAVGMMDGYDWHAPGCSPDADHANWYSAMIAAAPAVPQAEPKPTPASGDDLGVYKGMADSYRNDAEQAGAPYGIIDPDYGRVYTIARKLAWEEGYAIGLHGSFTRDLDLIAVPWTERACDPEHLIRRIVDATGLKLRDGVAVKPHGRRAWTLLFPAFGDPRFVDLSVMPRIGGSDAE